MADGQDSHRRAVKFVVALHDTLPQIERLHGIRDVAGCQCRAVVLDQIKRDLRERNILRIASQPVACRAAAVGGIVDGLAERRVRTHGILQRVVVRIRIGVPCPAAESFRGNACPVVKRGERLQSGDVGGERKSAVADRERGVDIELPDHRIMPGHQGAAVDRRRRIRGL